MTDRLGDWVLRAYVYALLAGAWCLSHREAAESALLSEAMK